MHAIKARFATTARSRRRAAYFDLCQPLLSDRRQGQSDHGFARLAGRYQGRLFDLQVLPDALGYRKLPCLWLMVTLTQPMPVAGTTDVMMRPTGAEVFSRFSTLPVQVALPADFPAHAVLRCDSADHLPPVDLMARVRDIFARPEVKELVIAPKGLRIVWLADQADRTRYLIYRDSELGRQPLDQAVLRPLLDRLVSLADALCAAAPERLK